eukprot:14186289-Alexandrium_andersonii.AAC.2
MPRVVQLDFPAVVWVPCNAPIASAHTMAPRRWAMVLRWDPPPPGLGGSSGLPEPRLSLIHI